VFLVLEACGMAVLMLMGVVWIVDMDFLAFAREQLDSSEEQ
jgi:hypothetical protein